MKKAISAVLIVVCLAAMTACSFATAKGGTLLAEGRVKKVSVSSLPKQYDYSYTGEDAQAVIDYISDLHLTPVDLDEYYYGMAWVITVLYEDGKMIKICHLANKYIYLLDFEGARYYQMNYEEASRFDSLLNELNG